MNSNRCVIFDIGSNNFQILWAELENNSVKIVFQKSEVSELSKEMINHKINVSALKRLFDLFDNYIPYSYQFSENIIVTGTACSRNALNAHEITNYLKRKFLIDYCIISSELEAYYTGLANIDLGVNNPCLCFDIGGGSTELCLIEKHKIVHFLSIPLGIRKLYDFYKGDYDNIKLSIDHMLNKIPSDFSHFNSLIGIGGAVVNFAAFKLNLTYVNHPVIHKSTLKKNDIVDNINLFKNKSYSDITTLLPFEPQIPEIIIINLMILLSIMDKYDKNEVIVSVNSYSYGLMNDYFTSHLTKELFIQNLKKKSKQDKCNTMN